MKKSDLYREWARVLDMCEGTKVSPFVCWNRKGYDRLKPARCAPEFSEDPDSYEFAVAILEDKPVFVGDKVYANNCTLALTVEGRSEQNGYIFVGNCTNYDISILSWNPPKKTFMLNGEELPRPVKTGNYSFSLGVFTNYSFNKQEDCNKVLNCINKILIDATIRE